MNGASDDDIQQRLERLQAKMQRLKDAKSHQPQALQHTLYAAEMDSPESRVEAIRKRLHELKQRARISTENKPMSSLEERLKKAQARLTEMKSRYDGATVPTTPDVATSAYQPPFHPPSYHPAYPAANHAQSYSWPQQQPSAADLRMVRLEQQIRQHRKMQEDMVAEQEDMFEQQQEEIAMAQQMRMLLRARQAAAAAAAPQRPPTRRPSRRQSRSESPAASSSSARRAKRRSRRSSARSLDNTSEGGFSARLEQPTSSLPQAKPHPPPRDSGRQSAPPPIQQDPPSSPDQLGGGDEDPPGRRAGDLKLDEELDKISLKIGGMSDSEEEDADAKKKEEVRKLLDAQKSMGLRRGKISLRMLVYWIIFFNRLAKSSRRTRVLRKSEHLSDFDEYYSLFSLLASRWILPAVKIPLSSVLLEAGMDLTINTTKLDANHSLKRRLLRLEIRITALCKGMVELIKGEIGEAPPRQVQNFVHRFLVSNGIYFPKDWLMQHEMDHLDMLDDGATWNMSLQRKRMMVLGFFFLRVAVPIVLMPWKVGIGRAVQGLRARNLKTVATMLYRVAVMAMENDLGKIAEDSSYVSEMLLPSSSSVFRIVPQFLVVNARRVREFADEVIKRYGMRNPLIKLQKKRESPTYAKSKTKPKREPWPATNGSAAADDEEEDSSPRDSETKNIIESKRSRFDLHEML
uniref:Uncharacterized protein n=1 Tax=Lotharella globosa TaxID=91324 RepID=A0A7S3ZD11_9EUKA|mmetsp:Transcript_15595/g.31615  ORF Transcript_15595/g.31615 Transcript_15595/m.31615 type:complete len:688 (-) Transcript_15595:193-2256(-)